MPKVNQADEGGGRIFEVKSYMCQEVIIFWGWISLSQRFIVPVSDDSGEGAENEEDRLGRASCGDNLDQSFKRRLISYHFIQKRKPTV